MSEINRRLSFDAGIERVVSPQDWQPLGLPETTRGLTSEAPVDQRLAEVLYPPSAEQALLDSLRPSIRDPHVLTPGGYHAALEETQRLLDEAAARAGDPQQREHLLAAAALLQEEAALHDLLQTYRHLLHRA